MRKAFVAGGAIWLLPLMLVCQLSYQQGWPVDITEPYSSALNIADINDDGLKDVIFQGLPNNFQPNKLYAMNYNGIIMSGFPKVGGIYFSGNPAILDSDDDGKLEIVATYYGLHMFDYQGNEKWYLPYDGPIFQSIYRPLEISTADLDNDGNMEIIATCQQGQAVFVFDAQGNVRPGWPVAAGTSQMSASIGDIDQDGQKEIIVGSGSLWCFKPDGTGCPGFPIDYPFSSRSKPVLLDIDSDGYLEIIFGWEDGNLRVLRYDGTPLPGYPFYRPTRGLAVGDIYRDGAFEVVLPWGPNLYAYDLATAASLPNFPFTDPGAQFGFAEKAPNICDVSDDTGMEIVAGASNATGVLGDGKLFAFTTQGQVVAGYPSDLLFHRELNAGCAVNDLDGDGDIEICCGGVNNEASVPKSSTVYCWDSPHPYNLDNIDWAMDGFDLGHTGRWRRLYHINKVLSPLSLVPCQEQGNPCYLPPDGSLIAVDVTAIRQFGGANPAGQDVRYSRTLGCGNYEGPVIDHGDGTYTRMLRAPLADCTTDVHAWVNEFKLADYQQIIFTNSCFQPPAAFNLIYPPNHSSNRPLTVTLSWQAVGSFPNAPTGYDLYFGPNPNPPLYAAALTGTQTTVSGLALGTRYFWKVVARNTCGATASDLWFFTTVPCSGAPKAFNNLSPPNGAAAQPLTVELTWQASTQAASYQVYLGTAPGDLALVSTVSGTRYAASGLCVSTTYYWKVVARNACGNRQGAVWSFTTGTGDGPNHPRPVSPP